MAISNGVWPARRRARRTASARLLVAMQCLDQENLPYTSAVLEFVGGGPVSVLRLRDLAEAEEIGLGGSLVVRAAALAAVSASALPGNPLCPGIQRRLVRPGRAFRRDLR